MQKEALQEVYRVNVLAKIMYAASAWWGFASAENVSRVDAFLKKANG